MINDKTITAQTEKLIEEYGNKWTLLRTVSLSQSCGTLTDEVFAAAITRHITDIRPGSDGQPVGSWPPKSAQVLYHAREIEIEQRQQANDLKGYPSTWDDETDQTYEAVQAGDRPMLRGQRCISCSDSGLSRFYFDPHMHWRIWTYLEWRVMTMSEIMRMTTHSCICDCEMGLQRPERKLTCQIPLHIGRQYYLWPRLEHLRTLAENARRREILERISPGVPAAWISQRPEKVEAVPA